MCPNDGTCESKCDGCLTGLNWFFVEYGSDLDVVYARVEKTYDAKMAARFI